MKTTRYRQAEFARFIGSSKQWVNNKIERHLKYYGQDEPIEFNKADGSTIRAMIVWEKGYAAKLEVI